MKKIALMHYAYPPNIGGVELYIRDQSRWLYSKGFKVKVVTGSGEQTDSMPIIVEPLLQSLFQYNQNLQETIFANRGVTDSFYKISKKIQDVLDKDLKEVDIVIIHNMLTVSRNLPFIHAFKKWALYNKNKKIITWVHDHMYIKSGTLPDPKRMATSDIEREYLTQTIPNVTYVAISHTVSEGLKKIMNFDKNQLTVIQNGINISEYWGVKKLWDVFSKLNLIKRFPLFLAPVNILERKNIEFSIEVLIHIKNAFPDASLIITGNTSQHKNTQLYKNKLLKLVMDNNLNTNVVFLSNEFKNALNSQEMKWLYTVCDGVFYFSKSENFGLPILEAGLIKTPLFLSDLSVFHEVAGKYGIYSDTEKEKSSEVAKKIVDFYSTNTTSKLCYCVRNNYSMDTIFTEQLLPLFAQ